MRSDDSGMALLEVIVALFILSMVAVSALSLASEAARGVARAREASQRAESASAFLEAVSLWTRVDLDRRLGNHRQGPWRLDINHPAPDLYTVLLTDSVGGALLQTALFRPDTVRALP